jgi:hypothetical protein
MLYRAVNADSVEPVQRLLEKQTAGQAVPCFMVSEASLSYTYDFALVDVITPCLFQVQFNINHIYPWKSLSFFYLLFSKSKMYTHFLFISYILIPCLSYHLCFAFGRSRISNLGSHTGYPDGFSCFTQFFKSNSRPGHYDMPRPFLCMTFLPFSVTYLMFLKQLCR